MNTQSRLTFYRQSLTLALFAISFFLAGQTAYQEVLEAIQNSTQSIPDIIRRGDSIAKIPSLTVEDSTQLKRYYRWRRDAVAHSTYEGASSSVTLADLRAYMANVPQFCYSGPQNNSWNVIGPNPTTSNYQELGLINAVAVDPSNSNIIYAGTFESGMWKSVDGGANWSHITDNLNVIGIGITCIAVDPNDPDRIVAGTIAHSFSFNPTHWGGNDGIGVIYSDDGGQYWAVSNLFVGGAIQTPGSMGYISEIKFSPSSSNIIVATGSTKIFKSIDQGENFSQVFTLPTHTGSNGGQNNGNYFCDVEFSPSNPNVVVATCKRSEQMYLLKKQPLDWVYYSTSAGDSNSWQAANFPNTQRTVIGDTTTIAHPHTIYVDATPSDSSQLYFIMKVDRRNQSSSQSHELQGYSAGNLTTFQLLFNERPQYHACLFRLSNFTGYSNEYSSVLSTSRRGFEVSNLNTDTWYLSGNVLSIRNDTDSLKWKAVTDYIPSCNSTPEHSTHGDIRDIQIIGSSSGKDIVLIANDGGVARSDDGGDTWNNINGNGLIITQFFGFDNRENDNGFIGSAIHNGSYRINDLGEWNAFETKLTDGEFAEWVPLNDTLGVEVYMEGLTEKYLVVKHNRGSWNYLKNQNGTYLCEGPLGRRFFMHPTWKGQDNQGRETRMLYACGENLMRIEIGVHKQDTAHTVFARSHYLPDTIINNNDTLRITAPISIGRFAPSNGQIGYLAMEGLSSGGSFYRKMLWKTIDGGTSWNNINPQFKVSSSPALLSDFAWVTDILVHPKNDSLVFVSMSNFSKDASGYGKNRVLYTTDGGLTWDDYSLNLPAVPANTLALDGENMLYVGTDAGVYFMDITNVLNKNPQVSSDTWTCFNRDLPNAMIEQLRIDRCAGKVYASVRGMGLWEAALMPNAYVPNDTISTDATWSDMRTVQGDIIIPFGKHLTITGSVYMSKSSQIIILPGGQLTIDGGYVGSACTDFWGGIYVAGNSFEEQTLQYQGILWVKNGGVIANARDGVTNSNIDPVSGNWIAGTHGGILRLTNAVFRNNRRDIQLLRYKYGIDEEEGYSATIENCQFIKDDNFAIETMLASVTLWDVHGIIFKGCTFSNENMSSFKYQGGGIYSINALFEVNEYSIPGLLQPSSFSGFAEAIRSENYALPIIGPYKIKVRKAEFVNNLHSIYISGANSSMIYDNLIQVPNSVGSIAPTLPNQPARYGIYMDMCPTFDVHENILKTDGINPLQPSVGIVVNSSGPNNNRVYKNETDGFTVGIEAIGINRNTGSNAADDGLYFRCNTFGATSYWTSGYGNEEDLYVVLPNNGLVSTSNGVALNHGYDPTNSSSLPNNLFENSSAQNQFDNTTGNTHNYHFEETTPLVEPENVFDVTKIQVAVAGYSWSSYCTPIIDGESISIGTVQSNINTLTSSLNADLALRTQLLNGGSTPALEAAILFADNQEEYQALYQDMMDMSPYVEDALLFDLVSITDYPELALRNIFVANPHGARNPELWEALLTRQPPLSQQTLDDIEQEQQTITAYDVLQMKIGYTRAELEFNKNKLIEGYLQTFETNQTNLMNFLASENDPTYHYMLVEEHLSKGNLTAANSVLSNIPNNCDFSHEETDEYTELQSFYGLVSNVLSDPEAQWNELGASDINTLTNMVNSGTTMAVAKANALLKCNGEDVGYVEPIVLPSSGSNKTSAVSASNINRPATVNFDIRVYPNPASGTARIEWNPNEFVDIQELKVQVSSMEGRILLNATIEDVEQSFYPLDLSNLAKGAYIVTLQSKDRELHNSILKVE